MSPAFSLAGDASRDGKCLFEDFETALDGSLRVEFSSKSAKVKGIDGHEVEITFPVKL